MIVLKGLPSYLTLLVFKSTSLGGYGGLYHNTTKNIILNGLLPPLGFLSDAPLLPPPLLCPFSFSCLGVCGIWTIFLVFWSSCLASIVMGIYQFRILIEMCTSCNFYDHWRLSMNTEVISLEATSALNTGCILLFFEKNLRQHLWATGPLARRVLINFIFFYIAWLLQSFAYLNASGLTFWINFLTWKWDVAVGSKLILCHSTQFCLELALVNYIHDVKFCCCLALHLTSCTCSSLCCQWLGHVCNFSFKVYHLLVASLPSCL